MKDITQKVTWLDTLKTSKTPANLDGVKVVVVPPGRAHGLFDSKMRARGGARLPPPVKPKSKTSKPRRIVREDDRAAMVCLVKFGR